MPAGVGYGRKRASGLGQNDQRKERRKLRKDENPSADNTARERIQKREKQLTNKGVFNADRDDKQADKLRKRERDRSKNPFKGLNK
jgi:hypothetical protein